MIEHSEELLEILSSCQECVAEIRDYLEFAQILLFLCQGEESLFARRCRLLLGPLTTGADDQLDGIALNLEKAIELAAG